MFIMTNRRFAGVAALSLMFRPDGGGGDGGGNAPAGGNAPTGDPNTPPPPSTEETVPYARFQSVNEALRQQQQTVEELNAKIKAYERQGQTDAERLQAELQDAAAAKEAAEKRAADLEQAQARAERNGWIRDAAAAAKFHDPADAVARLSEKDIKTAAAAERAVSELATSAPHLVGTAEPSRDAASQLQRVLDGGRNTTDKGQQADGETLSPDAFNALTQDELVRLQVEQPDVYARSLKAAAAASS